MTWTPQYKVIDQRLLAQNLLAYMEANQTDALTWANDGPGLSDFQKFYTNASGRLQTIFPCLMVLGQQVETGLEDSLQADFRLVLEGAVSGSDTDELVASAKVYAMAVESMAVNIPSTTLMANAKHYHSAYVTELNTVQDVVNRITSGFLQVFRTTITYRVEASGV
jgi:hypothetical protein